MHTRAHVLVVLCVCMCVYVCVMRVCVHACALMHVYWLCVVFVRVRVCVYRFEFACYQVRLVWLPLPCIALIRPSQLGCLSSSVGRASTL